MTTVILLTAAQADAVRGPSSETPNLASLEPVALTDGRFILGIEVLNDPSHAENHAALAALPTAAAADIASLLPQPEHG